MCLAVPARIVSISGTTAIVDMEGNRLSTDISIVADVAVGDWVIVHAGFAIQKYDETEALQTLETLKEVARADTGQ